MPEELWILGIALVIVWATHRVTKRSEEKKVFAWRMMTQAERDAKIFEAVQEAQNDMEDRSQGG